MAVMAGGGTWTYPEIGDGCVRSGCGTSIRSKEKSRNIGQPWLACGPHGYEIRTCRCMISFAIDSIGAAAAWVGVGLVGGDGRAMYGIECQREMTGVMSDGQLRSM